MNFDPAKVPLGKQYCENEIGLVCPLSGALILQPATLKVSDLRKSDEDFEQQFQALSAGLPNVE